MAILDQHKKIETNATLLLALSFVVVTIGVLNINFRTPATHKVNSNQSRLKP